MCESSLLQIWTLVLAPHTPHTINTYTCIVTIAPRMCGSIGIYVRLPQLGWFKGQIGQNSLNIGNISKHGEVEISNWDMPRSNQVLTRYGWNSQHLAAISTYWRHTIKIGREKEAYDGILSNRLESVSSEENCQST